MIIAFDLDDVLADTTNSVMQFHNERYGTSLTRSDFTTTNWSEVFGSTKEETYYKFEEYVNSPYYDTLSPTEGSLGFVTKLAHHHTLVVITSRQRELETHTKRWIHQFFPALFRDVYVTNHPQWARTGIAKTKKQVCDEIKVDLLIEDNLDYAIECVTPIRSIYLLNTPWNQGITPPGVIRIQGWDDIKTPVRTGRTKRSVRQ